MRTAIELAMFAQEHGFLSLRGCPEFGESSYDSGSDWVTFMVVVNRVTNLGEEDWHHYHKTLLKRPDVWPKIIYLLQQEAL